MKFNDRFIINTILLALIILFIIIALNYPLETKMVPLVIGIPALFLMIIEYVAQIFMKKTVISEESEKLEKSNDYLRLKKEINIVLWIIGFVGITYFFGFNISIPLFLFSIYKFQFSYSTGKSLLLSFVIWTIIFISFDQLLNISLNCGILVR